MVTVSTNDTYEKSVRSVLQRIWKYYHSTRLYNILQNCETLNSLFAGDILFWNYIGKWIKEEKKENYTKELELEYCKADILHNAGKRLLRTVGLYKGGWIFSFIAFFLTFCYFRF